MPQPPATAGAAQARPADPEKPIHDVHALHAHRVPISDLVAAILSDQLGSDGPDLSKVARLLRLHPRALQRSLSEEGMTFTGVLDRVRKAQALDLITTVGARKKMR